MMMPESLFFSDRVLLILIELVLLIGSIIMLDADMFASESAYVPGFFDMSDIVSKLGDD
jgi:hypothetical protein